MTASGLRQNPRPVVLCVLDGWGCRNNGSDNAIARAATPNWDAFMARWPHARLETSGRAVGLPDGQMGNSEVGHMNLGAGRVVLQDLPRIDEAIASGELVANPNLRAFIDKVAARGGTVHLMGLMSPGGVHSHQDHLAALANAVAAAGLPVRVHAFLDGRDTPPRSARDYLKAFAAATAGQPTVQVATVTGRYFAMDRDQRWERVSRAYAALVDGAGEVAADAQAAVAAAYDRDETDEFVQPTVVTGYAGMRGGDGLLMANFRADRAREMLLALLEPEFAGFPRSRVIQFAAAAGMVEYSSRLSELLITLFPPERLGATLGELVAEAGMTQLRIAETEKYAHVTFFLNGGEETVFPGEDRILVPSPKVATYDLQPEMSAPEVTDRLVAAVGSGHYDLIVVNYANPDMVGHTGVMAAAVAAVETVDACLGRLAAAVEAAGGVLLITADHGNIEMMQDDSSGQPHTAHTTNPVPVVLVNAPADSALTDGRLCDVAPTLLHFLGLRQPPEMTGRPLLQSAAPTPREARARA